MYCIKRSEHIFICDTIMYNMYLAYVIFKHLWLLKYIYFIKVWKWREMFSYNFGKYSSKILILTTQFTILQYQLLFAHNKKRNQNLKNISIKKYYKIKVTIFFVKFNKYICRSSPSTQNWDQKPKNFKFFAKNVIKM